MLSPRRSRFALAALFLADCGRFSFETITGDDAGGDDSGGSDASGSGSGGDGSVPDTAVSSFCAGKTSLFCDDFESGNMAPWEQQDLDLATIGEEGGELVTRTQALADNTQIARAVWHHPIGFAAQVTVAFDIETPVIGINDPVVMMLVFGVAGADQHYIEWIHKLDGPAYIEEIVVRPPAVDVYYFYPIAAPMTNASHRISVSYDALSAVNASLQVSIDGTQVIATTTADNMAGDFYVNIGVPYFNGPSTAWELHTDNVLVTSP